MSKVVAFLPVSQCDHGTPMLQDCQQCAAALLARDVERIADDVAHDIVLERRAQREDSND